MNIYEKVDNEESAKVSIETPEGSVDVDLEGCKRENNKVVCDDVEIDFEDENVDVEFEGNLKVRSK